MSLESLTIAVSLSAALQSWIQLTYALLPSPNICVKVLIVVQSSSRHLGEGRDVSWHGSTFIRSFLNAGKFEPPQLCLLWLNSTLTTSQHYCSLFEPGIHAD
jgi:hypothetical protein